MTEPHETFTWYDQKSLKCPLYSPTLASEMNARAYIELRNRRIVIRRALFMLGALVIGWGLVLWLLV